MVLVTTFPPPPEFELVPGDDVAVAFVCVTTIGAVPGMGAD